MPPHDQSSPTRPSQPRSAASPAKAMQPQAFREPSSSPQQAKARVQRKSAKHGEQRALSGGREGPPTFLEETIPMGTGRSYNEDGEDPHDLSFNPTHVPRASMVDNMVRSLDHFSNPISPYDDPMDYGGRSNMTSLGRRRGHTLSSSVSSESDVRDDRPWPQYSAHSSRLGRRNSAAKFRRQRLPSIVGEDEDSVRARAFSAQRAAVPPKASGKKHSRGTDGKGSAASIDELSHLNGLRLGPAGNRRSQSLDYGSRRPKNLLVSAPDPIDVAPTPVIFSGPEAQNSPIKEAFGPHTLGRRNSNKSSKSTSAKKGRVGNLGTNTMRALGKEPVPSLPSARSSPALFTALQALQDSKAPNVVNSEAPGPPRPGFFRRVFGSSRNTPGTEYAPPISNQKTNMQGRITPVINEEAANAATPPQRLRPNQRTSTDVSAAKETQQTIVKKTSFFRRRKKSTSNTTPPPLPLTLGTDTLAQGEPSPISSLKAVMNPFLGDVPVGQTATTRRSEDRGGYHTAQSTPQLDNSTLREDSKKTAAAGASELSSPLDPSITSLESRTGSRLRVPHQDSFLADSSSTDEPLTKSAMTSAASLEHADDIAPSKSPITSAQKPASVNSSLVNVSSARPAVPPRQDSKRSDNRSVEPVVKAAEAGKTSSRPRPRLDINTSERTITTGVRDSPAPTSDTSEYKSAPSTPQADEESSNSVDNAPLLQVETPTDIVLGDKLVKSKARQIYDNEDPEVDPGDACGWLGDAGPEREHIRKAYVELFDLTGMNILAGMRSLCDRIAIKGETQQVDRILDAFAQRWCDCNKDHGFKSSDVVHTICYSVLLLNTDLHLADIGQKMTKTQFVRNALPTIRRVADNGDIEDTIRATSPSIRSPTTPSAAVPRRSSVDQEVSPGPLLSRPTDRLIREDSADAESLDTYGGPLVNLPFSGSERGWEAQIELVLKSFYTSISRQRLPLYGAPVEELAPTSTSGSLLSITSNMLRRTPSTLSKGQSDMSRGRHGVDGRSFGGRWVAKARSRPRLTPTMGFGSSRTSLDEQSSGWSPSMSSTWSRVSLGKTLTSVSMDSLGSEATKPDYQSSIGFANALSQAIIRDDQLDIPTDDGLKADLLLEDESLELCGAPWAKEGILKHKCHLEGVDKRSKDRNWNDCFAVVEKGWMRLFSFSTNAKSIRQKAKSHRPGAVVGGGNWQDNAEELWKFTLRHTIASALPPPGYSKARPYVFALSLPTGAVHLFSVGTPDIVKEFVTTANYWSARLSKEPMMGGISNMEYGWSDTAINRALVGSESQPVLNRVSATPRPSTQMSMRSSIDHGTGVIRPKLPGDKMYISDWSPPQQSMMASQLLEVDQLKNLQTYVKNVEDDLQKHNELRPAMLLAFSPRHPNTSKAMGNWERKSSYLLREIVKFRTYIDALQTAQGSKERVYAMRREDEENRQQEDDSRALSAGRNM